MKRQLSAIVLLLAFVFGVSVVEPSNGQTRRRRAPARRAKPPAAKPAPTATTPATTTPAAVEKAKEPEPEPKPEAKPEPPPTPKPKPGPTIWHDPGVVEKLDFRHGPGGRENAPKPPFTFIEEDLGGSNAKVKVRDAAGREWGVKWGSEVNSEVFASRLVWATGYYVEATYFVPAGRIEGVTRLTRAKKYVATNGNFTDARFELKEKGIKKLNQQESWRWDTNPFVGSKEFNGLRLLVLLTSNWDSKDQRDAGRGSNTAIFKVKETGEERYLITDWGGTMGKWGSYFSREKWDCRGYQRQNQEFITSARNDRLEFGYKGQRTSDVTIGIRVSDVRWLMQYLGRITDQQLREALEASGATSEEVGCFLVAVRERIEQLKRIAEIAS